MSLDVDKIKVFAKNKLNLPIIEQKKTLDIQVQGAYDLMFPYMQINFPTKEEILQYVYQSFFIHDLSHGHNGDSKNPSTNFPTVLGGIVPIPAFITIMKNRVRAVSPVNKIGYGV